MQAKNESTSKHTARSTPETTTTRPSPASLTRGRGATGSPGATGDRGDTGGPSATGGRGADRSARRTRPDNAFSAAFLEAARQLELRQEAAGTRDTRDGGDAFASGAPEAGPFTVEPVVAGWGTLWAVVRRGEPYAAGGSAVAVFVDRTAALLAAAVLPASATPHHLSVADKAKRLGLPIHDGRVHLGHLAAGRSERLREHLPRDLHVARHLATHPQALVLLAEALDFETLVLFGRALMRRMERLKTAATATA